MDPSTPQEGASLANFVALVRVREPERTCEETGFSALSAKYLGKIECQLPSDADCLVQPSELASTVFPCGVRLLASLAPPTYYSNCLTKENGARVAVHCLRFVAEVPQELLSIVRMRLGVTLYTSAAADAETDVLAHLLRRPIYSHYVVAVVTRATGLQLTIRAALEAFAHAIPAGTVPTREHLAGLHAALVPRPSVRQSRPGLVLRVGDIEFPLPPPALHVWRMPRSSVRCRSCGIAAREARCSLCDMCPTCAVSTQQGEMDSVTRAPSIRPCVMGLPVADVNFRALFAALDVGNVLQLFAALLTGRSTLLVSSSLTRLGDCSAALLALMWPLEYCAAHIGIAYEGMSPEYIHTLCDVESQTLFGVHRDLGEAIARVSPFTAALTVDLDRNTVTVPPELPVHRLPARYALRLFRRVLRHANLFRFYHPSHVIAPLQLPFEASPFEVAMAEKLAKRAMLHSHDSATSALADLASHRDFPAAASPASPASPAPSAPATHAAASLALSSDLKRWMHAPAAHAAGFAAAQPAGDVDRSLLSVRARSSTTLDVPTKARGVRWAPTARYRTVSQLPAPELRLALAADPAREAIVKASPRRQCASPREVRPVDEELRLACTLYSSEEEGDEHEGEGEDGGEGGPEAEAGAGAVVTLADPAVDAAAAVAAMRPLAGDAAAAHHRTEAALRAQREWERWQCFLQPPVYLPDGADEEEADWPLADPVRPLSVFRAAANGVPLLRRSSSSLGEGAQLRGAGWLGRASRRVRAFSKHVIRRTSALTSCLRIDCTPGTRTPFGVPTVPEAPADAADADAVAAEAADAAADSPLPFFLADAAAALGGESALQDFRQRLHQRFGSLRPLHPRDKAGYRKLSAEEVEELCKAGLRLLEAVPQGDHLSAVSSQPCVDTFMGREAITTMLLCGLARTPADAEALARRMIAAGIIQHVGNAPAFGHGHLYHFTEVFRKVMEPVIRFRQQGGGWHRRQPSRPRSVRATAAGHGGEARPHVHAAAATPQLQELLRTPASGGVDTSASAALSAEAANHAVSADATTGTCAAAADMLAHAPTDAAAGTAVAAPLTRADVADEGSDLGSLDPTDFVPAAWEPPFSEQGVRNAFCAVIVSIFKGYRPYLTIPDAARLAAGADSAASQAVSPDASPHALPLSTHDLFDRKRFMQEQVPPDANPFVEAMLASQTLEYFLQQQLDRRAAGPFDHRLLHKMRLRILRAETLRSTDRAGELWTLLPSPRGKRRWERMWLEVERQQLCLYSCTERLMRVRTDVERAIASKRLYKRSIADFESSLQKMLAELEAAQQEALRWSLLLAPFVADVTVPPAGHNSFKTPHVFQLSVRAKSARDKAPVSIVCCADSPSECLEWVAHIKARVSSRLQDNEELQRQYLLAVAPPGLAGRIASQRPLSMASVDLSRMLLSHGEQAPERLRGR